MLSRPAITKPLSERCSIWRGWSIAGRRGEWRRTMRRWHSPAHIGRQGWTSTFSPKPWRAAELAPIPMRCSPRGRSCRIRSNLASDSSLALADMLAIGLRWRNLNRRQNRPRQTKRERGAQQADHDRERQIEACAGAWQLGIAFNAFRGLGEAPAGDHDGNDADDDESKPGPIGEAFAMRGKLALGQLRRRDFEEQIEPLDDKTEGHHRDGGADPGEKGALVGGVVAVALDHVTNLGIAANACNGVYARAYVLVRHGRTCSGHPRLTLGTVPTATTLSSLQGAKATKQSSAERPTGLLRFGRNDEHFSRRER